MSAEIWGFGSAVWPATSSGISLSTASLGGRVKVLEPTSALATALTVSTQSPRSERGVTVAPATPTPQYEVYLIGKLSFTGFSSPIDAEARLEIKPNEGTIFTATVVAGGTGSDLDTLSKEMDADAQSDWINIYPSALDAVAFSQNQLDVYIDFGKSTFCLYGAVTNIGSILVVG